MSSAWDCWQRSLRAFKAKFSVGTRHTGIVKTWPMVWRFVEELGEGIGGMIHISYLSWQKRFNHPSEFIKVGQTIDGCTRYRHGQQKVVLKVINSLRKIHGIHSKMYFRLAHTTLPQLSRKMTRGIREFNYVWTHSCPTETHEKRQQSVCPGRRDTHGQSDWIRKPRWQKILVSPQRYLEISKRKREDNIKRKDGERVQTKRAWKATVKMESATLSELGFSALKDQLRINHQSLLRLPPTMVPPPLPSKSYRKPCLTPSLPGTCSRRSPSEALPMSGKSRWLKDHWRHRT